MGSEEGRFKPELNFYFIYFSIKTLLLGPIDFVQKYI